MGWKKLGGEGREFCRSLEYLLETVQALKEIVRMGRMLDGKGGLKMDLKEVWCPELLRSPTPASEDTKATLRQMKDAKKTLAQLTKSLDVTIQAVTDATIKDCQADGFALLPDDILAHIFEMYIDECIIPDYDEFYIPPHNSPLILSSVCRRFREIVHHVPNLWRHISLAYPKELLRLHRERCANPSVHILPARDILHTHADMIDKIHPYTQWRELQFDFLNEDHAHRYFERLQPLVMEPFHSLEYLSISNDLREDPEDEDSEREACGNPDREYWGEYGVSIYLDEKHMSFVSSWQMPKLTHLELRNFMPHMPLQCGNVTRLSIRLSDLCEDDRLELSEFQDLFGWMPKIESLLIHFDTEVTFNTDLEDTPQTSGLTAALPRLTHLDLGIEVDTPDDTIIRFMTLVDTRKLTRLALKLRSGNSHSEGQGEAVFEMWVDALFLKASAGDSAPFACVEEFTLDAVDLPGSPPSFEHIFTSLPNVRHVSLKIPRNSKLWIAEQWIAGGAFQHLRSLHIEVFMVKTSLYHKSPVGCHPLLYSGFEALCFSRYCDEFEEMKVRNRVPCFSAEEKARLQFLFKDKLHWIDC
ncbi:hypothetical protein SCHPADRAFT_1001228 [Schizopora paradoxa]|uniref:F-box domain-containing protein n=1 Tax=Schizopora paradoxa TaxID=27342 RepID=A0A0H2R863_9AGAM|nr:hypothetical protein SCHPADRAFT_1001228 [Schizopora paradoxa]